MAEDMHCVHVSYLLGPVSAPLLSVMSVGTLWRWLETCTVCTYPIYLDWCPLHFSQCCWLQVHCGEGWRLNLLTEDIPTVSTPDHFLQCYRFWLMIDDRLYSTILCSLEQTHCARMWFYMSDKHFIARFFNIHWSGILKGWHGWCHMKLLLPRCKFCGHHTTMLHVTSCKAAYIRCMHV